MKRDSISTEALVSMDPELKAAILARDSDRVLAIWHEMKQTRSEEWHQNKAKFEALMALLIDHGYNSGWQLWTKWQQGHLDDRLVQWLLTKEITKLAFHHTKYQHIDDLLDKLILGSEWVECIGSISLMR
jgi:hypothetical protein